MFVWIKRAYCTTLIPVSRMIYSCILLLFRIHIENWRVFYGLILGFMEDISLDIVVLVISSEYLTNSRCHIYWKDRFNIMYDTQKYIVFIECNISFGICISELCHPLVGTSTRRDVFLKILQMIAKYTWVWIILESEQGPVPPLWHWMISDHSWLWIGSQKRWWRCK